MKTKIFVILLSLVALVSFTALVSNNEKVANKENQTYQSSGGQTMSDPHQFD